MKKSILILFLFSITIFSYSQTSYKSYTDGQYVEITITQEGSHITYSIHEIERDDRILGEAFYNLTEIEIDEKGNFDIPGKGKDYYYIPFNGNDPLSLYICTGGKRTCGCYASGPGHTKCKDSPPFCHNDGCNECHNGCSFGGGGIEHTINGGGILVYATSVSRN